MTQPRKKKWRRVVHVPTLGDTAWRWCDLCVPVSSRSAEYSIYPERQPVYIKNAELGGKNQRFFFLSFMFVSLLLLR